jgi:hypothetical protein
MSQWTAEDRARMRAKSLPKRKARYRDFTRRHYDSFIDAYKAGFEAGYRARVRSEQRKVMQ